MNNFTLEINVIQHNIDNGIRFDCKYCPISLAMRDALRLKFGKFGVADYVSSDQTQLTCCIDGVLYKADTPPNFDNFIYHFDSRYAVAPVSAIVIFRQKGVVNQ